MKHSSRLTTGEMKVTRENFDLAYGLREKEFDRAWQPHCRQ